MMMIKKGTTREGKWDKIRFINTLKFMTLLAGNESVCGIEDDDQRRSFDQIMGLYGVPGYSKFTGKQTESMEIRVMYRPP